MTISRGLLRDCYNRWIVCSTTKYISSSSIKCDTAATPSPSPLLLWSSCLCYFLVDVFRFGLVTTAAEGGAQLEVIRSNWLLICWIICIIGQERYHNTWCAGCHAPQGGVTRPCDACHVSCVLCDACHVSRVLCDACHATSAWHCSTSCWRPRWRPGPCAGRPWWPGPCRCAAALSGSGPAPAPANNLNSDIDTV